MMIIILKVILGVFAAIWLILSEYCRENKKMDWTTYYVALAILQIVLMQGLK